MFEMMLFVRYTVFCIDVKNINLQIKNIKKHVFFTFINKKS